MSFGAAHHGDCRMLTVAAKMHEFHVMMWSVNPFGGNGVTLTSSKLPAVIAMTALRYVMAAGAQRRGRETNSREDSKGRGQASVATLGNSTVSRIYGGGAECGPWLGCSCVWLRC